MSERTFHVLVVAPLRATRDHAINDEWRGPVRFERATFDEAMATVAPALAIDVPDPTAPAGKPVRVDLSFEAMRSFRPDVLMEQVPILKALRAAASYVPPPPEERPRPAEGGASSLVDDILGGMEASQPAGQAGERGRPPTDVVLEAIVAHPEVRRLERAWRGLQLLASRSERDVVVEAVDASADEVDAALDRVARRTDAAPIDLIVVDHEVGSSRRDLDRLESWASLAEGIGAPLVANALPELVGLDDVAAVGRTQRRLRSSDDPRAAALRSVAAREPMRWVALAMNGAVARPRHLGPVKRTFGVTLDEAAELFVGPAVLVASLCVASFARTGWACAFTGPTNGVVRDLPVRTLDDRGAAVASPLEALVSEEAAAECAAAGIAVFASAANADVAILPYAPVLLRPASTGGGTSAAASVGLTDQLFVARVAQAIAQLAAAIPGDTEEAAARDVARLTLAELFGDAPRRPELDVAVRGNPRCLEVVLRPRGFHGVRLEEVTLGAPLG